jgi:hypothetical protein
MRNYLSSTVVIAGLVLAATAASAGQDQPPPINGVIGTIALEGTVDKTYQGINTIAVKTADGVRHVLHLTTRMVVHGGNAASEGALDGLEDGSRVVVHYTAEGDTMTAHEVDRLAQDGLKSVNGVIAKVDRRAKTISIRLADGSLQTLRLTERAASDVGKDLDGAAASASKVVVYYTDDAGHRTAHYFKRVS